MSFDLSGLTPRMVRFWSLRRKGHTQAKIANQLGITRQTVNKAFNAIDSRLSKGLMNVAKANRIQIRGMDVEKGILTGHSQAWDTRVMVLFSERKGIQVLYDHDCRCEPSCAETFMEEAEDWGIEIPKNTESPAEALDVLFEAVEGV